MSTLRYKQITDEENFEFICVNFMFKELYPRMDIKLSPEIANVCKVKNFSDLRIFV